MATPKIFISHSHKDQIIARALVDMLEQIGVDRSNIISSSSPKAQIHTGSSLYGELRSALSNTNTLVIFLLSDNFYSSPVCMNEMGAAWIMDLKFHYMLLPAFSFEKVKGVITEKNPIGISLSDLDDVTISRFNDLYSDVVNCMNLSADITSWSLALRNFFSAVEKYRQATYEKVVFAMDNVESYCIGDTDNDGCRIIRRESSIEATTAKIDFGRTSTKLCCIVYTIEQKNWTSFFDQGKTLCFEAYCDAEPFQAELELHMADRNKAIPLLITDDTQTYRIPLAQFTNSVGAWEKISELCFLFRRKHVDYPITFHVSHLRLEN